MSEGRDLRNKVCFSEGHAYAMGGLNSKAERLNYSDRKWSTIPCYPLSDNLDSWASCMLFTPKLFSNKYTVQDGLNLLMGENVNRGPGEGQSNQIDSSQLRQQQRPSSGVAPNTQAALEAKKLQSKQRNFEEMPKELLIEKEKELDKEVAVELELRQVLQVRLVHGMCMVCAEARYMHGVYA